MKYPLSLAALAAGLSVGLTLRNADAGPPPQDPEVTYDDTPLLPNGRFRVHGERPWPRLVTPAPELGQPPSDAVVLFDGDDIAEWKGGEWKVEYGYMEVAGRGSLTSKRTFGDLQLHLEFATPAEVKGSSQGRGNSGVFLMGRYEVQILDSYQNPTYPDGQAAALYGQCPPLVNACRPPGEWQSYDVVFRAPRFDGEELASPASVTVIHNGVVVHHDMELIGATTHRKLARYSPHPPTGPITLQNHGNPMRFRNVWVRPLEGYDRE